MVFYFCLDLNLTFTLAVTPTCDLFVFLPYARGQTAEQEGDISLDKRWEESKHAVDGERDEERLPSADAISQPPPDEGPDHHPQVHDQTYAGNVGEKSSSCQFGSKNIKIVRCNLQSLKVSFVLREPWGYIQETVILMFFCATLMKALTLKQPFSETDNHLEEKHSPPDLLNKQQI